MAAFRACIFDLFGTLVPTTLAGAYHASLREGASVLGLPEEDFVREWHATYAERNRGTLPTLEANVGEVCRRLGVEPDAGAIARSLEPFRRMTAEALAPKPESEELLARLRALEYRLGLISNCNPEVPGLFRGGPLAPFFDEMIFSSEMRVMKPDPSIYLEMTRRLRLAPEACLYIGDGHERELAGASSVGMTTVRVEYDLPGGFVWGRDERADHYVVDLREILPILSAG
jgi:putative hydrolase of the HAD superfamily